jgi:multidrug resistance efflux pump
MRTINHQEAGALVLDIEMRGLLNDPEAAEAVIRSAKYEPDREARLRNFHFREPLPHTSTIKRLARQMLANRRASADAEAEHQAKADQYKALHRAETADLMARDPAAYEAALHIGFLRIRADDTSGRVRKNRLRSLRRSAEYATCPVAEWRCVDLADQWLANAG